MIRMSKLFLETIRGGNIEGVRDYLAAPNLLSINKQEAVKAACHGAIRADDDWDRNNFFQIFTLLKNHGKKIN